MGFLLHRIASILAIFGLILSLQGMPLTGGAAQEQSCTSICPDCLDMAAAVCAACSSACFNVFDNTAVNPVPFAGPVALSRLSDEAMSGIESRPPVPPPRG
jgi:hypothetical protein